MFDPLRIELHYLPTLAYFQAIGAAGSVTLEASESYQKQTFRNRATILTSQGLLDLVVPIKKGRRHQPIREVEHELSSGWNEHHWRSICTAYGKAPFFDHYAPRIEAILAQPPDRLYDLNRQLLTVCLAALGWQVPISDCESFLPLNSGLEGDFRGRFSPEGVLPVPIEPYPQLFGNEFAKQVSLLDALFCTGPQASLLLRGGLQ